MLYFNDELEEQISHFFREIIQMQFALEITLLFCLLIQIHNQ